MKCKYCQYHTSDGRCLYYIGCPYEQSQNEPTEDDLLEFEAEAEELAHLLHSAEEHLFTGNLWNYEKWTEWLKQEADDAT